MKTAWMRYAVTAGLAGAVVLIAVAACSAQVRKATDASIWVAQYCAPAAENSETHRIYCRDDRG
jgi:hypothetical protein